MKVVEPITINETVLTSTNVPLEAPALDLTKVYGPGDQVTYDAAGVHDLYQQIAGGRSTVTLPTASPGLVLWNGHGRANGQKVVFSTTGALPSPLVAGTQYFIVGATTNNFQVSLTAGGTPLDFTGTQSGTHTAVANTVGNPLTATTYWQRVSVRNAYKMFDDRNDTATSNPDLIDVTLHLGKLATGVYLGGLVGTSAQITVTDPVEGVVLDVTQSLLESNSGSSFYGWYFNPITYKDSFINLNLPAYFNASIRIRVYNPGSNAQISMFAIGRVIELGFTQYGIGLEEKDYSTTTFDKDGVSTTIKRGYSRNLTMDVKVENDKIDSAVSQLLKYRQLNVLWVGDEAFGHQVVFGKRAAFRTVMPDFIFSIMSLTINGVV